MRRFGEEPASATTVVSAVVGAYGAAATAALVAVGSVRDRTALTCTLALLAFVWLLPAPAALVVAVVRRSWRLVALVLVPTVVLVGWQLPVLVPGRAVHGVPAGQRLRVATYNISHGAPVGDVVALARRQRPDVLLLQEVTRRARTQLGVLDAQYRYRSFAPLDGGPLGDGNAVLSRFPVRGVRSVGGLPRGARPTDVVTLAVRGGSLDVISVHLASPCVGCSTAAAHQVDPAGSTGPAARVRVGEAHRYAALVRAEVAAHRRVVLAGDVNSSDLNVPLPVLRGAGLVDVHRAVGTGPELTRGPGWGTARIDVVLVAGLRPLDEHSGPRGASTHAPVVADLGW